VKNYELRVTNYELQAHRGEIAGECQLAIGDCRMALRATDFAGQAETIDVLIAPDGAVKSTSGDFTFDEESWAAIDKAFREHGTMLVIDYEHQTLGGDYTSPDGTSPAAGWVKLKGLRYEKGKGLIASVAWTERARNMIRAGEYQYVSPVLIVRKADRKAIGLHSVALTNKPAIEGMMQVAAKDVPVTFTLAKGWTQVQEDTYKLAAGQRKDRAMNELLLIGKDLGLAEADCKVETITDKIGELKKRAETAEVPGATVKAVCKALGVTEGVSETEIVARVAALKDGQSAIAKQGEELKALKQRVAEREADDLMTVHGKGKLNPNAKEVWAAFKDMAVKEPERFVKVMSEMPVTCPEGRTTPPEGGAAGGDKSRETIIANSTKKFRENASLHKLTTCNAFVSLALQDAGQDRLSVDEAKKIAV